MQLSTQIKGTIYTALLRVLTFLQKMKCNHCLLLFGHTGNGTRAIEKEVASLATFNKIDDSTKEHGGNILPNFCSGLVVSWWQRIPKYETVCYPQTLLPNCRWTLNTQNMLSLQKYPSLAQQILFHDTTMMPWTRSNLSRKSHWLFLSPVHLKSFTFLFS